VDIAPEEPDFGYVHKAKQLGLIGECTPSTVCPDVYMGRAGVALMATLIANKGTSDAAVSRFANVPPTHPFLRFIERAAELDLMAPCPASAADAAAVDAGPDASFFCPEGPTTRRTVAIALSRARDLR